MSDLFFYLKNKDEYLLPEEETHHCIKVCRHRVGDVIEITDGKGNLYKARIESYTKKYTEVSIVEAVYENYFPENRVGGLLPVLDVRERYEFMIEKTVELGITDIFPVIYERSQRRKIKEERLEKIVRRAIKQCKRPYLPVVYPAKKLTQIDLSEFPVRIVAMQGATNNEFSATGNIIFAVGPEGGFTEREAEWFNNNNFTAIKLGDFRLRSETAVVVMMSRISYC